MIGSLLYSIARFLFDLLSVRDREHTELQAEVLALRHQMRVLQWQVRRPRWRPGDRLCRQSLHGITKRLEFADRGLLRYILLHVGRDLVEVLIAEPARNQVAPTARQQATWALPVLQPSSSLTHSI